MIYPRSSPRYIIYERVRVENGVLWKFGKVSEFVLPPTEISLWNSIHRPSSIEDKPTSDRYILSPSSVTLHTIWNNLFIPYTAIIKSSSWMHRSKGAINSTNTIKILLFISRLLVDLEKKKNTSAIFQGDRPSIFIHGGRFPREKEISRERVRSIIGWRTIWFESKANSNGPGNNLMNNLVTRQLLSRFFPRCSSPRLSIVKPVHVGEAGLWGRSKREAFDQKSAE